eukprot:4589772-Pleurochrysis_carterae.AAC.3
MGTVDADAAAEESLLRGILQQARIESLESVEKLLAQSHIKASDLIAEPEHRTEVMLQVSLSLVAVASSTGKCCSAYPVISALHSYLALKASVRLASTMSRPSACHIAESGAAHWRLL